MLCRQSTDLGTVSVEQTLSCQTATGERAQGAHGMIPFIQTHRVNARIKQHHDSTTLIFGHHLCPNDRSGRHQRTTTQQKRDFLLKRVEEIAVNTAKVFRGEATFTHVYGMGPLVCDEAIADLAGESLAKVGIESTVVPTSSGTEDFTAIANEVPAVMVNLGAAPEGVTLYPHHNPKMVADEGVMPYGAAAYVQFANDFLNR